jgi:hypothetical protein
VARVGITKGTPVEFGTFSRNVAGNVCFDDVAEWYTQQAVPRPKAIAAASKKFIKFQKKRAALRNKQTKKSEKIARGASVNGALSPPTKVAKSVASTPALAKSPEPIAITLND